MDDHVSLYRCKKCAVRMYLRDCARHHATCVGGAFDLAAFTRGPIDQHAKPGGGYKSRYAQKPKPRAPKPAVDDDDT